MKVAVASDHGGYALKEELLRRLGGMVEWEFVDFGTDGEDSVDYPDYARIVAKRVVSGEFDRGILICGTGLGMAIAANKVRGIRAVTVHDPYSARMTRAHNDTNILTMGGRVIGFDLAEEISRVWLSTTFEGGRHQRRIDKIKQLEQACGDEVQDELSI